MRNVIGVVFASVLGVGCATEGTEPPPSDDPDDGLPDDMVAPVVCPDTVTLDGAMSTHVNFGPLELGTVSLCLHLDTRQNRYAHFMAGTPGFDGETSPSELVMTEPDGTVIVTGWDVTVGRSGPAVRTHRRRPSGSRCSSVSNDYIAGAF